MWIASRPNAFIVTLFVGLAAGFFLGAHAVTGSNVPGESMIGVAVFGAIVGAVLARRFDRAGRSREACPRPDRGCDPALPRIDPVAPRAGPASAGIEDAQAALVGLGYKARDARKAVMSALATLDADADAAAIIKAALKGSR
jgi:RuvA, C-terminal domain